MELLPRKIGDKRDWVIIPGVTDADDLILISLIDNAPLLIDNNQPIASFRKGAIITKKGNTYTYDPSDLMKL